MVIFINDVPIQLVEKKPRKLKKSETVVTSFESNKNIKEWRKKIIFPKAKKEDLVSFFRGIKEIKSFNFKHLTFVVDNLEEAKKTVFQEYKIVDAAGGVILNKENKLLMIYRLDKWDLPKGKAEKGESIKETAIREVEEECGITVSSSDDYYISYHTYLYKNQRVLKRTFWYKMTLISDEHMTPQKNENIEDVRWMNRAEMHKALTNSYPSIANVLNHTLSQELSFSKG